MGGGQGELCDISALTPSYISSCMYNRQVYARTIHEREIPKEDLEKSEEAPKETCNEEEIESYTAPANETETFEEILDCADSCQEEVKESPDNTSQLFWEGFDSSFKAYMDYRCITDTSSVQYELQQQAYTDQRGFRRIGDDYCIALGTGFTEGCGQRFAIYLDSGYSFTGIVSDVKSDAHTDATCCYVPLGENRGNVVEFIIDSYEAQEGMLSSGNAGFYEDLSGNITAIVPL